jgi:hypothetical protein
MSDIRIPGDAIDANGKDLLEPLQGLLTGISALGSASDSTGGAFSSPSQGVAIIEAGATALTKWWSGAVAAVGGATVLTASITKFWNGQQGGSRIALLAVTGGLLAAVAIALAIIVSSDVRGRATGAAAIYATRAQVASSMLELICCSQKPAASAGLLSPDAVKNAANDGVKAGLAPISDQLNGIDKQLTDQLTQLTAMDKSTALIVLGATQLQSAGNTVLVTSSRTGVTGELQDVFVGPGSSGASDVQVNIKDDSSQSIKAIPLSDVVEIKVTPRGG